jgi:hypothetical protein
MSTGPEYGAQYGAKYGAEYGVCVGCTSWNAPLGAAMALEAAAMHPSLVRATKAQAAGRTNRHGGPIA